MTYRIEIQNIETKEIRTYTFLDVEWKEHSLFWLTDGNFGCDCNREQSFRRAAGEPDLESDDLKCGDGRYKIIRAILDDGTEMIVDGTTEPE